MFHPVRRESSRSKISPSSPGLMETCCGGLLLDDDEAEEDASATLSTDATNLGIRNKTRSSKCDGLDETRLATFELCVLLGLHLGIVPEVAQVEVRPVARKAKPIRTTPQTY